MVGFKSEIIFHPENYARSLRGAPVRFLATSHIPDDVEAPRPVQSSQGAAEFHGALTVRIVPPHKTQVLESPLYEATQGGCIRCFRRDTFEAQGSSLTRELFDMV